MVHFEHKFENVFQRVATENNVRQRSKDIYKSLNVINQEIQARGHHNYGLLFKNHLVVIDHCSIDTLAQ